MSTPATIQNYPRLELAVTHLKSLMEFNTTSANSNRALIDYMDRYFASLGMETIVLPDKTGTKANLIACIGPTDAPGIVLSGHTDVVPATREDWSTDPFQLIQRGTRLYGRGSCDMKGFAACVMAMAPVLIEGPLARPFYFCFSHDEEVGCLGAPAIAQHLAELDVPPGLAIIGEPSEMQVINGQKGKIAMRVTVHGKGGHSSFSPQHVNAVEYAARIITMIADRGRQFEQTGPFDHDFTVPHSTTLVSSMNGGVAINVTPDYCEFIFELRSIHQESTRADMRALIDNVETALLPEMHRQYPSAYIGWEEIFSYPAMGDATGSQIFKKLVPILPAGGGKVSYGSEGGVLELTGGIPSIILGPRSIRQAHEPDEFIEIDQIKQCIDFFDDLSKWIIT